MSSFKLHSKYFVVTFSFFTVSPVSGFTTFTLTAPHVSSVHVTISDESFKYIFNPLMSLPILILLSTISVVDVFWELTESVTFPISSSDALIILTVYSPFFVLSKSQVIVFPSITVKSCEFSCVSISSAL